MVLLHCRLPPALHFSLQRSPLTAAKQTSNKQALKTGIDVVEFYRRCTCICNPHPPFGSMHWQLQRYLAHKEHHPPWTLW